MIKEIEVGGVKHSITLADDMVGSGLVKTSLGKLTINPSALIKNDIFLGDLASGLAGSGLRSSYKCIDIDLPNIVGSGLGALYGRITPLVGSGFTIEKDVIDLNIGYGLQKSLDGLALKITTRSSGLRLFFNEKGELDVTQD